MYGPVSARLRHARMIVVPVSNGWQLSAIPVATSTDRRKRYTTNCGGLSEIRSGVLVKSPLEPSASCAEQEDPTREARSKEVARSFLGRLGKALPQIVSVHDWYELDRGIQI